MLDLRQRRAGERGCSRDVQPQVIPAPVSPLAGAAETTIQFSDVFILFRKTNFVFQPSPWMMICCVRAAFPTIRRQGYGYGLKSSDPSTQPLRWQFGPIYNHKKVRNSNNQRAPKRERTVQAHTEVARRPASKQITTCGDRCFTTTFQAP